MGVGFPKIKHALEYRSVWLEVFSVPLPPPPGQFFSAHLFPNNQRLDINYSCLAIGLGFLLDSSNYKLTHFY